MATSGWREACALLKDKKSGDPSESRTHDHLHDYEPSVEEENVPRKKCLVKRPDKLNRSRDSFSCHGVEWGSLDTNSGVFFPDRCNSPQYVTAKHISSTKKLPPITEDTRRLATPSGLVNNYTGQITWPDHTSSLRIPSISEMNKSMDEQILAEALDKYARISEKKPDGGSRSRLSARSRSPSGKTWRSNPHGNQYTVIPLASGSGSSTPTSADNFQTNRSITSTTSKRAKKAYKGRGLKRALSVGTSPLDEYIADRRHSRTTRTRPWTKNMKQSKAWQTTPGATDNEKPLEVYYESHVPKGKWIKFRPMVYAHNHKHGLKYEVRENSQFPRLGGPPPKSYMFDNNYNVWLYEKKTGEEIVKEKEIARETDKRMKIYERHIMPKGKTKHARAHRDIVESFHCHEINRLQRKDAALILQKWVRGWLVRKRMRKLKRETMMWHNKSWSGFVDEYKKVCTRVQQRHGIQKGSTPFQFEEVEEYMKKKKKYEDVFDKLQGNGKLPREMLKAFFSRCDLYPSDNEIATAFDTVFRGCGSQADIIFLLDLSASIGEHNFRVQKDFIKSVVTRLQIGKEHVRVGVIPYNDDLVEPILLGRWNSKDTLFDALEKIPFIRGLTHTHLAIEHMRSTFNDHARKDVQKIGVVLTDGRSYYEHHTHRQADKAKLEGCKLYAIGVGSVANRAELHHIATDPTYIGSIYDTHVIEKIKTDVSRSSCLRNCSLCHYVTPDECKSKARGLFKNEVMDILWTIYVPKATGLKDVRRSTWVRPIVHDEEAAKWMGLVQNMESEDFRTCLRYVIKCKLEREGGMNVLSSTALNGVERVTDWDAAVKSVEEYMKFIDDKKELHNIETNFMKRRYLERKLLQDRVDKPE
ncbi:uncharacterized protein LOC135503409 [Lineus longissimus]|uniref:uncharacterized protein LOC135503409 n=1 Tax=Lineus longissimus TaxID=88925 RepID=UPI00315D3D1D